MSADKHEMNQAGPQRAGIWLRVSHELSVERESPEIHEARLRAFCLSKGCEVIEVYRLDAVSGRDVTNHPETLRMLADVRRGHINLLVFSKLARLARNTKHLLEFLDIFNEHGAALISLGESLDTNTAAGKLFYTLVAAMAEWEREEIAARIREAVETRMGLGKCVSGSISLGYHWVDGLVEPKQDEIAAVKRCFQLHKELRHYKKVARRLDRENFRGKNNRRFNAGMVRRIINDPIYIGKYRRNHTFSKNGERGKKPESEWVYLDVRPIISKELWDDCQSIVKERKPKTERGRAPKHLFAGLVWCACGNKMYVPTEAQKHFDCPKCHTKMPKVELDKLFIEQLQRNFCSDDAINSRLADAVAIAKKLADEIKSLQGQRMATKKEMDLLYRLYINEEISGAGFKERNDPLEQKMLELADLIESAKKELAAGHCRDINVPEVADGAKALVAHWSNCGFEEKQGIAEELLDKIVVAKEKIEFHTKSIEGGGPMTKRLRSLMAAQPFCHCPLTCERVVVPSKLTVQQAHGAYIMQKVKEGWTVRDIERGLRTERGFHGEYSIVRREAKRARRELRAQGQNADSACSKFSRHRAYIESRINGGKTTDEICSGLRELGLPCTERALENYILTALPHVSLPAKKPRQESKHAKYIPLMRKKFDEGKSIKQIHRELQREVQFEGAYTLVAYHVGSFRRGGAKTGPLPRLRKCDPHKAQIIAMLKQGVSPSGIRKLLSAEHNLTVSDKAFRQYIKDIKAKVELVPNKIAA